MIESRLIEIEIKLSRQEDLVDVLNATVYRQQRQIDQLEQLCAALARQSRDEAGADTELAAAHQPPPHY